MRAYVIVSGVGGQGVMLLSRTIATAAQLEGYEVSGSEIHGHAVRGGTAYAMVSYGDSIGSPRVPLGRADALLSTELLEGLRWSNYLRRDGFAFVSTTRSVPVNVTLRGERYPTLDQVRQVLGRITRNAFFLDPERAALSLGERRLSSAVMYGAFASAFSSEIGEEALLKALRRNVPRGTEERNVQAFNIGRGLAKESYVQRDPRGTSPQM